VEFAKAVLRTGVGKQGRCYFSTEVFDGRAGKQGEKWGKEETEKFCRGAMESYGKLLDACVDTDS